MRFEQLKVVGKSGRGWNNGVRVAAAAAVAGMMFPAAAAHAAPSAWTGATSNNFGTSTNWSAGVPGISADGTTAVGAATDVATFPTTVTTNNNVLVDQTYTLGGVVFSGAGPTGGGAAVGYTLSGGTLQLTAGTTNTINENTTSGTATAPVVETVASPVVLLNAAGTASGAATFQAGGAATNANASLLITGTVTGSATAGGTTLLKLVGAQKGEIDGVISDGTGGGQLGISVGATSTWTLTAANTFSGTVSVVGANPLPSFLRVSSINSVATNAALGTVHSASSNLGAPTTVANGTIAFGANSSLVYLGTGETTDRVVSLTGGANGGTLNQSGTGLLKFVSNLSSTGTTGQAKTLTLAGGSAGTGEFAGVIGDDAASTATTPLPLSVAKSGAGTWTLSGANTYTGTTSIAGGSLNVTSINSVGAARVAASNLGAPTTVTNGTIAFTGGSLTYTGTGETTDRVVALTGGSGTGGTLTQSGTGLLRFTSNVTQSGGTGATGAKALTLAGSTAGTGELDGNLGDDLSNTTGTTPTTGIKAQLTKTGTGTWTVAGNNTFTGTATVNGGTLRLGSGTALGGTFAINNLTTNGTTTATYPTPTGSVGLVGAGNYVSGPGLAADTFVTAVSSTGGVTTLTLSAPASTSGTAAATGSAQVQLTGTGTIDLNGQNVTNRHINVQDGTSILNSSTTPASVGQDLSNQTATVLSTTGTFSVGGTGDINVAGVNGGTLNKVGADTLTITPSPGAAGSINLLAGAGTVRMGVANALAPTSTLTLTNGGTFATGGFNQALAGLTVGAGNGILDFGNGASDLTFGALTGFTGTALTVNNWSGNPTAGGGTDQLVFTDPSALTPAVLAMIDFAGYAPGAMLVNTNEVVPANTTSVPEPASLGLLGGAGLLALARRRRSTTAAR